MGVGLGTTVGHYVVRSKLGEGAMGTVFLGQHTVLDTRVAIKVIRRDVERTEEDVSRFFTEARAASRIGHENIVGVMDFGQTEDGDPYYIMEHLAGETLAARLQRGRPAQAQVLHVARQIAAALAAAHAKGIVHRDLKPANVFLVRRGDDQSFVKLLDFGVAKLTTFDDDERGHRTHTGRLLGTPHYMAPEQVAGRKSVDGRADVYALGVMIFEMLSGRLPFDAPKWTEVLIQHVTVEAPRLRGVDVRCPRWLDELVARALAKTPQERPHMAAFGEALRRGDASGAALPAAADVGGPSAPPEVDTLKEAGAPGAAETLPGDATLPSGSAPPRAKTDPGRASDPSLGTADTLIGDSPFASPPSSAGSMPSLMGRRARRRGLVIGATTAAVLAGGLGAWAAVTGGGGLEPTPTEVAAGPADDDEARARRKERLAYMRRRMDELRREREAMQRLREVPPEPPIAPAPPVPPAPSTPRVPGPGPIDLPGKSKGSASSPGPPVRPPGPLPAALDGYDIEQGLAPARQDVAYCVIRYSDLTRLRVTLVVGGDGRVRAVSLPREHVGTPLAMCVQRSIDQGARFPPFAAAEQTVVHEFGVVQPVPP